MWRKLRFAAFARTTLRKAFTPRRLYSVGWQDAFLPALPHLFCPGGRPGLPVCRGPTRRAAAQACRGDTWRARHPLPPLKLGLGSCTDSYLRWEHFFRKGAFRLTPPKYLGIDSCVFASWRSVSEVADPPSHLTLYSVLFLCFPLPTLCAGIACIPILGLCYWLFSGWAAASAVAQI